MTDLAPAAEERRREVEAQKRLAARRAVEFVEDGMLLGLGTGSTAAYAVGALAERLRGGLKLEGAVPTSEATRAQAERLGIPLKRLADVARLHLAIDGADEVDPHLNLVKGGGGALLREKVVESLAERFIVVVDASKLAPKLGGFPLPVEVAPFAAEVVARAVERLGGKPRLRLARDGGPFLTDNGFHLLDCDFGRIDDPPALAAKLDAQPGVAEHGLFCGMASLVVVGRRYGVEMIPKR
ncbi:MAG TPA: ribose-5-phosphate isomerase RpiA [Planctomycetota bacterium]|nr:ribose-5-phosphate isomerase RpiA [Planctomycetota bacterium]